MNILENFIEKHIDKPWHWGKWGLSRNPSISPEFIEKHIDRPWEWGKNGLSMNTFIVSSERIKARTKARNKAARIIQIKFLDWFYKPICKDGTYGLNCLLAMKMCS